MTEPYLARDGRGIANMMMDDTPSSLNSTTSLLSDGQTFVGVGELSHYQDVMVSCKADVSGTLFIEFSNDNVEWDTFPVNGFNVEANTHEFHIAIKGPRYFRVRFVNGSSAQSSFRIYSYFGNFRQANSPLNQNVSLDSDAIHVRPTNFQDEVRIGRRLGVTGWTKFAHRTGLTGAGGEEMIWATTGNFTPMTQAETFTISYSNVSDGASSNGAKTLYIQYIDSSGLPATAIHTLSSSGSDITAFTGFGINRVVVVSSGSTDTNGANIVFTATLAGTTQAIVPAAEGVTQQAVFFVGSNHDAVVKFLFINLISATKSPTVLVKGYVYNRSIDTRFEVFRLTEPRQESPVALALG